MINFVTNLAKGLRSGGFTARSAGAYDALSKAYDVTYVGPIDPPVNLLHKAHSKAFRVSGLPGDFFFFTEDRLRTIAAEVEAACAPQADFDFFHGFTPWILTSPRRPYIAWNDCTFHDYMEIFHRRRDFRQADLQRIEQAEAAWLKRARQVIFRSEWAAKRAIEHYDLDPARVRSVCNFGEIAPPEVDVYAGSKQFAFISTNFAAKGGWTVLEAFRMVRRRHRDATLVIVGDRPVGYVADTGVEVAGYLRKESPEEEQRLRRILGQVLALVHPTTSDISPAVLVEAAYFGCPVISSRSFAIPEVVQDGITGLLLDDALDAGALASAMCRLLEDKDAYLTMRGRSWARSRQENSREQFERALLNHVQEANSSPDRQEKGEAIQGWWPAAGAIPKVPSPHFLDPPALINFVSNLPRNLRSGGFSAMNVAAYDALSRLVQVNYVGPIDPAPLLTEKALSKASRVTGGQGDFYFFSPRRLAAVAHNVDAACARAATFDFFHGFTPWVMTRPARPYVAWSDCTFRDYVATFHERAQFRSEDLARIEAAEAQWLSGAERVLFTSDWARSRAIADYGLDPARTACVGIFGEVDVPRRDAYDGGKTFVFVSTNFEAKGGAVVLSAYRRVRTQHPGAQLVVVGDHPASMPAEPGVEFCGFLRKEVPQQAARFNEILAQARAVVHPTKSDIAPLLLVEAGYFGCPVISTRRFAIPELVEDGRTGLLLDDPESVEDVARAMIRLLGDDESYMRMRRATWSRARKVNSRARFEERMAEGLSVLLAGRERPAS